MSKIRVDEIGSRSTEQVSQPTQQVQRRKELNKVSKFERSGPQTFSGIGKQDLSALKPQAKKAEEAEESEPIRYTLPGGKTLEIPQMSAAERERAEAVYANLSPESASQLRQSMFALGAAVWNEVETNPACGLDGVKVEAASANLQSSANTSYEVYTATTGEDQRNGVTEDLLVVGLSGVEDNLEAFFQNLQGKQEAADEMRTDIAELESMLADWPEGQDKQLFSYREVVINEDGSIKVVEHKNVALTKEEAQELLTKLKGQQDSLSTITTMDSQKLQLMVEKYQQAMNTLSNIIKAQDDTRKGIIGNIKA